MKIIILLLKENKFMRKYAAYFNNFVSMLFNPIQCYLLSFSHFLTKM